MSHFPHFKQPSTPPPLRCNGSSKVTRCFALHSYSSEARWEIAWGGRESSLLVLDFSHSRRRLQLARRHCPSWSYQDQSKGLEPPYSFHNRWRFCQLLFPDTNAPLRLAHGRHGQASLQPSVP